MDWITSVLDSAFWQAALLAALTGLATRLLEGRGKLIWSVSHQHIYAIPRLDEEGNFPVRTQQIWLQNPRRSPIEEIEIVLNWRPQHFEIWNPRQYSQSTLPDGRLVILVPNLSGKEAFTLSMIDTFRDLPIVLNVRYKGGLGEAIAMGPQRILPNWVLRIGAATMIAGITAGLFLILQAALWVISYVATAAPVPS